MVGQSPLWKPSPEKLAETQMSAFQNLAAKKYSITDLHSWSIEFAEQFWNEIWDFCSINGQRGEVAFQTSNQLENCQWYPQGKINYAQNLLNNLAPIPIITVSETGQTKYWRQEELLDLVSQFQQQLLKWGFEKGDHLVCWTGNGIEAVVSMLATSALGGVFSSASLDFGHTAVVERFSQLKPKVLVTSDGYVYNGKVLDRTDEIEAAVSQLNNLEHVVVSEVIGTRKSLENLLGFFAFESIGQNSPESITFAQVSFNDPAFVLFTSGTTGLPKGIVHRAGGFVLKHSLEQRIHCDIKSGDVVFFYTTTGWMMWNWLISNMMHRVTVVLYDGNPSYPGPEKLFDLCDQFAITFLGVGAKLIDVIRKSDLEPIKSHALRELRTLASTGSPLSSDSYDWIMTKVKTDLHLASISGGTDICGCFIGGNPNLPVWSGEIQGPILGQDVDVIDENGQSLKSHPGVTGELVNRNSFPTVPIGFVNDTDGTRFHDAYFAANKGMWTHGDFASFTENGGIVIHGRSDATLNPGGVRIGTAEIYRVVERVSGVKESIVVGQNWNEDVRIVLFVVLVDDQVLTDEISAQIKLTIRQELSPRHVPAKILQVWDIPHTRSGKIAELAVKQVIENKSVKNVSSLANPQALEQYTNRIELQS